MKLTLSAEVLRPAIQAAANLAPKSGKIPQLECVRIDATPDVTVISAANLVESIRLNLPVGSTCSPGTVFVPSENLLRAVKEAKKEDVTIEWDGKKLHAKVSFGTASVKLPTEAPENQRGFTRFDSNKPSASVPGSALSALIKRTQFSVQKDFSSRTLGGISVKIKTNLIELAATDGRRMAVARIKVPTSGVETEAVVPVMTPKLIDTLIDPDDPVDVQLTGNVLIIKGPKGETTQRLIAGDFPPYETHLPWTSPQEIEVERKVFMSLLKRASLLKVAGGIEAVFVIDKEMLQMTATAQIEGSTTDAMEIAWPYDQVQINLDHTFIHDALKSMESEKVVVGVEAADKPFILRELTEGIEAVNVILPKVSSL
jgi:DNA polymerase-3 subunit beta